MKRSIAAEINQAQNMVENALDHAGIQKKMGPLGYDRKALLVGRGLYKKVRTLHTDKHDKYGSQYASTDTLQTEVAQAKARYKRHLKTARLAFEDNRGVQEILQIRGQRKKDRDGWMEQANTFYSKIHGYTAEMARLNTSAEDLEQAKVMVEALYTARQQQLQRKGEAQHATHERDQARKELKAWMSRFKKTARFALQDEPQLLEILGILVPSEGLRD